MSFSKPYTNTNIATTNWLTIGSTQANGSGVFSFTDTNAPSFPMRFYGVLSPKLTANRS